MAEIVVETTTVLANLLDAFIGESNAHARYLAFAARRMPKDGTALPDCSAPPRMRNIFMPAIMRASPSNWAAHPTPKSIVPSAGLLSKICTLRSAVNGLRSKPWIRNSSRLQGTHRPEMQSVRSLGLWKQRRRTHDCSPKRSPSLRAVTKIPGLARSVHSMFAPLADTRRNQRTNTNAARCAI